MFTTERTISRNPFEKIERKLPPSPYFVQPFNNIPSMETNFIETHIIIWDAHIFKSIKGQYGNA